MTRVAVIACDHGLGHVRRAALVAHALAASSAEVSLLAPAGAAERVRRALGIVRDPLIDDVAFETATTPAALRSGDPRTTRWEERLPGLDGFDAVLCDTLPEVLAIRPDAVLLAQFLWHDVLDGVDASYRERSATLARTAATVVGSEPFAMPAVRALPGFVPVGLHAVGDAPRPSAGGDALLISGGTTPALVDALRALVDGLVRRGPGPYRTVQVDAALVPAGAPPWLVTAQHVPETYDRLAAAVVRPGLGVVTELLARSVPMWCVHEEGNRELVHNASEVVRLGAGSDLGVPRPEPTWIAATLAGVLAGPPPSVFREVGTAPRFDGARATAARVLAGP